MEVKQLFFSYINVGWNKNEFSSYFSSIWFILREKIGWIIVTDVRNELWLISFWSRHTINQTLLYLFCHYHDARHFSIFWCLNECVISPIFGSGQSIKMKNEPDFRWALKPLKIRSLTTNNDNNGFGGGGSGGSGMFERE